MQGSKSLESLEEKRKFAEIMADPDRRGLSIPEIAQLFNIAPSSIYNKIKEADIEKLIKDRRKAIIKIELPKVDTAIMKKAQKGDVKAAELVYTRWDDYDPRGKDANALVQINITQSDGTV